MTIYECYRTTCRKLREAGIEDESFEAKQIVRYVTKMDNASILSHYNDDLDKMAYFVWDSLVKQRVKHEPLQYLLGEWEFYGLRFSVGEGCLCPRADTETLVETAFRLLKDKPAAKVLDLCAGSGCVGVTIANKMPQSCVTLVEKYDEPFAYCRKNAETLAKDNAVAVKDDLYDYTPDTRFDLIVANPPYISAAEMQTINAEAAKEPETALYGGEDGLDYYRAILIRYPAFLCVDGVLAVEIGANEGTAVTALFAEAGFTKIGIDKDLSGHDRVVFGTVKTV